MAKTWTREIKRAENMNAVMNMALHRSITRTDVIDGLSVDRNLASFYIKSLLESGRLELDEERRDRRFTYYRLAAGAMPLEVPTHPKDADKPPPENRGPKLGSKNCSPCDQRKITVTPAQQIGIPRDPLVAALFGGARC